jgi:hypothetical protein
MIRRVMCNSILPTPNSPHSDAGCLPLTPARRRADLLNGEIIPTTFQGKVKTTWLTHGINDSSERGKRQPSLAAQRRQSPGRETGRSIQNTFNSKHVQFKTRSIQNTFNSKHARFKTRVVGDSACVAVLGGAVLRGGSDLFPQPFQELAWAWRKDNPGREFFWQIIFGTRYMSLRFFGAEEYPSTQNDQC